VGKKRTRKTVVSKGQRRNIVAGVKEVRQALSEGDKLTHKRDAWRKGQNPWVTVPGTQTNKRFVRVRANVAWGDPKRRVSSGIYGSKEDV
jgi:hypothetical protein